jgi:hypothetical protein
MGFSPLPAIRMLAKINYRTALGLLQLRISDCGLRISHCGLRMVFQSAIRNPQLE